MTTHTTDGEQPVVFLGPLGTMRAHLLITTTAHTDFLWRGVNDAEVTQYLSTSLPFYHKNEVEFIEGLADKRMSDQVFTIADENLEPIGICGLHRIDWISRRATFGIAIYAKDRWSKGYGTEALMLLLNYAFSRLNLHKVRLEVYAHNARARKVYERCGFKETGVEPEHVFKDGVYHDSITMTVLRRDWLPVFEAYKQKVGAT